MASMNTDQASALGNIDISKFNYVRKRHYGRMIYAGAIVVALFFLGSAFVKGQIEWSYYPVF